MALPSLHLLAALKTTPSILPRLPLPSSSHPGRAGGGCSTARRWGFRQPKPGHGGAPHPIPVQAPRPAHGQPGGITAAHVGKGAFIISHLTLALIFNLVVNGITEEFIFMLILFISLS